MAVTSEGKLYGWGWNKARNLSLPLLLCLEIGFSINLSSRLH